VSDSEFLLEARLEQDAFRVWLHPGLSGRWDFTLNWTPDETPFVGMNPPRPVVDDANAPPPLFTAIQQQLGLKLEPQKADAPVMLVEHVERPSPN
jgi:uncharacterized protein (TIGR03435 family)